MCLHSLRLITSWSILIPSKYLVVCSRRNTRIPSLNFALLRKGKRTIRLEAPIHFQTGSWQCFFVLCLTKTWMWSMGTLKSLERGEKGGGRGTQSKVKVCCQGLQTLTLFKTKKRPFRLFPYSLTCIDYFASHTVFTWLNYAVVKNQINNVAFNLRVKRKILGIT